MRTVTGRIVVATLLWSGVALSGCDDDAQGRAQIGYGDEEPCEDYLEATLACAEGDCDEARLEEMYVACNASGKADGFTEGIQEQLARRAAQCYEARDADCLKSVYGTLAVGARIKGLHQAAAMMSNFLSCGQDVMTVDPEALRADSVVAEYVELARGAISDQVHAAVMAGTHSDQWQVSAEPTVLSAGSQDIWYAMGNFTAQLDADIRMSGVEFLQAELTFSFSDRYDWHPGLTADGSAAGVAAFQDDWAVFLVEEGVACEFDMRSSFTEALNELGAPPIPPPSEDPPADGEPWYDCSEGPYHPSTDILCDGVVDCFGGEDESDAHCADLFTCADGSTIQQSWVCDNIADCPDGEDEADCDDGTSG